MDLSKFSGTSFRKGLLTTLGPMVPQRPMLLLLALLALPAFFVWPAASPAYPFVAKWRGLHGHAVGLCTAELVAPLWVVTAAHCAARVLHNESVKVHVELVNATTRNLRRDVVPHGCAHAPGGIDVALCKLTEAVGEAEAKPVALSAALFATGGAAPPGSGVMCVGTYHGLHATGPKPLLTEVSGAHLYVDNTNGSGMHAGDSGGAWLLRSAASSDEWVLAAVIHGGERTEGGRRGVASQLSYIGAWVNATTGGTAAWAVPAAMAAWAAPLRTDDDDAAVAPCGGGAALLFAYWTAAQWRGLHLAYSCDGLSYTALNDNQPLFNTSCGTMRDVFLRRGPDDKTFHMVSTGSCGCQGGKQGFNTFRATLPFTDWHHSACCWMGAPAWPNTTAVWAPEWQWVEEEEAFLVFWSSETDGQAAEGPTGNHFQIYGAWSKDFGEPREAPFVLFAPNYTIIDADIVPLSQQQAQGGSVEYTMVFVDGRGHNSLTAAADGCSVGAADPSQRNPCPGWQPSWDNNGGAGCLSHGCCFNPHPQPDPEHNPWCFANTTAHPPP